MTTPTETIQAFTRALTEGDVDAALSFYEPDAVFQAQPDAPALSGAPAIREALEGFAALEPSMTNDVVKVHEAGDIALLVVDWQLRGTSPDGQPVEMGGTSADVLRRRDGGGWGILVDDPWGAARAA